MNNETGTTERPNFKAAIGDQILCFSNGNKSTGQPGTILDDDFMNMLLLEGVNLVQGAGLSIDAQDASQWLKAVKKLISNEMGSITEQPAGVYEKTPNTLALRNAEGRVQVAAPKHDADATPMAWVVSELQAALKDCRKEIDELRQSMHVVGDIRYWACRANELKTGWYMCNGTSYALTTPQGQALFNLSPTFKSDWKIVISGNAINVPNLFDATGRGMFLRAVNGVSRQAGSIELDQEQGHGHELKNGGASVRAGASREIPNLTNQRAPGGDRRRLAGHGHN
ncbi:MAG: phage tail protein [Planctomycetaceae bacterium]|nr:phage tail protein [Planctomycetaceae bacterium]